MSTPCDMQSFIVWMIAVTAERETARREMSRWSESRAIVIALELFVVRPMNTGWRCSVWRPSCQARKTSVSGRDDEARMQTKESKIPEAKLAVTSLGEDLS